MNREVLRSMDTGRIPVERLISLLQTFTLKHAARALPDLLETADLENASNKEFLLSILETEVKGRNERRRKRNYAAAHFPPNLRPLEEFDPEELDSGITQAQVDKLKELSWLDNGGNIVLAGPPGLGKTMVATGLGLHAVNSGYTVCFEKMVNLVKILDTAETERTAGFRLKNLKKAQLIIIDEIGYTPISRSQANRFFTLISDTYETSSIIFTTNKEIVDWAEMMGDPVLTTALLDRILHHANCYSFTKQCKKLVTLRCKNLLTVQCQKVLTIQCKKVLDICRERSWPVVFRLV